MKTKTNALFQPWFCSSIHALSNCYIILCCVCVCVRRLSPNFGIFGSFFRHITHARISYFRLFSCSWHCDFVTHHTEASAMEVKHQIVHKSRSYCSHQMMARSQWLSQLTWLCLDFENDFRLLNLEKYLNLVPKMDFYPQWSQISRFQDKKNI